MTPTSIRSESPDRLRLPPGRLSIVAAAPPLPRVRSRVQGFQMGFDVNAREEVFGIVYVYLAERSEGVKDDSASLFY